MNFSAVVLAGGESRRMGRDKALIHRAGQTLLAHQIQILSAAGAAEIFISHRPPQVYEGYGLPLISDAKPGMGPLAGVAAAFSQAKYPLLAVLAVDLPAMTAAYFKKLSQACLPGKGVVPRGAAGYEPLAAIYPQDALALALACLKGQDRSMRHFVQSCARQGLVSEIPILREEASWFANWNCPADVGDDHP